MALVIGSIAAATAPAAILAIVLEYRARGPMTTTLLGVVALDDAITIFLYAFAISVAQSFLTYDALTIHKFVLEPFIPVVVSLLIGGAVGVGIRYLCRLVSTRQAMLGVMLGAIFITAGLGLSLKTHALLANMMSGFVAVNIVKHHEDIFEVVESIEEPMFGMFFALAGAHLNFKLLETAGLLAVVITVGRFAGKLAGSWVGSRISGAPTEVKRYLGFALLPTAGVTVGLVLDAQIQLGSVHFSGMMLSGVLGSVIINELITPFLVRFSLFRAGEAASKAEKK